MSSTDISHLYALFGLTKNPDGSFTRSPDFIPAALDAAFAAAFAAAYSDPADPIPVLTKDVPINEKTNTWARLYLPQLPESDAATKLPLIVFFHGGGFIIGSPATSLFQKLCYGIVRQTPAVMVSVGYRLAPEHRLPAAYEDGVEALHWIKSSGDEWLTKYADFSKCFILGNSAGGNIAYNVGLRFAACADQLMPLKIQGLILHQPFFGGVQRSSSEIRLADDKMLPQEINDIMWDLALPVGIDRDHDYCNPTRNIKVELLKKMKDEGWRMLVAGYEGDPFVDRQVEVVKMLRDNGVDVVEHFGDGGCHGIEFFDDSYANIFFNLFKNFLLTF